MRKVFTNMFLNLLLFLSLCIDFVMSELFSETDKTELEKKFPGATEKTNH